MPRLDACGWCLYKERTYRQFGGRFALEDPLADEFDVETRPWALLAYLCGDNPQLAARTETQVAAIAAFTGTSLMHVAAQWDLPAGACRGIAGDAGGWRLQEQIGRVNTGDPETFVEFLRWGFDRCPAERIIIVASGTGLLDPLASVGQPGHDRSHLFTIADDATASDALSLCEIGSLLCRALDQSARERVDILALDMRELQCLEVAYEIEDAVDILIAPQTRTPDQGWDFGAVLTACAAKLSAGGSPPVVSPPAMARALVQAVGTSYDIDTHGVYSLSALDLRYLSDVAAAFDTASLALMHSVGEELVWAARESVAQRLKAPPPGASNGAAEAEYLYDLPEMLSELQKELADNGFEGLLTIVLAYFEKLDLAQFARTLETIDGACFVSGSRLRDDSLESSILDPAGTRRRLRRVMLMARAGDRASGEPRALLQQELRQLFTAAASTPTDRRSWLEGWDETIICTLEPGLATEYRQAAQQQQRLRHLAQLAARLIGMLTLAKSSDPDKTGGLVFEHFVRDRADGRRHGGVSLFRPRNLDQLVRSDYLQLRFNKRIHWTVLLAVINLIGHHPRALWRILSAVLATADNTTRAALLNRITGPGSVIASFKEQFVVLAPVKAVVLSLEPDAGSASLPQPLLRRGSDPAALEEPQAYRVRLELADRDAVISEVISIVDPDKIKGVLTSLVKMIETTSTPSAADVSLIESLGDTLGEDILQDLGITLARAAETFHERIHLQLQIPRELMRYPWELMHHKNGWLSADFALGRQVFTRTGGGTVRARVPGPLRALIVGNPVSDQRSLPYAAREATRIADAFEALAAETDGLIDFVRARDAHINSTLTEADLRQMLRHGNYDILHFAGHAYFDKNRPESSAWILSDGPFSAQSIRNTLRWRETQPWLVYANACEAAMDGTPQTYQTHVFGLVSALLDQGVNVCISPLWRIDDEVAAQIAEDFYLQLLKQRQTVGEALRIAKSAAKTAHYDPFLHANDGTQWDERLALVSWAGLVLYGNSTATVGQRFGAPPPAEQPNTAGSPPTLS